MNVKQIVLEDVSFQYENQKKPSIDHASLHVHAGEFLVLTGESGCGKTSLTRCINHLIPHFYEGDLQGTAQVLGKDIRLTSVGEAGKRIASIFQDPRSQFFTTNSSCEVAFACENYGVPHEEMVRRVENAFSTLGIQHLREKNVFDLSSGERQKIAFAAALTLQPDIFVLDEPSANLDIQSIYQIHDILLRLKQQGHTVILSEHRLFYLNDLADRFIRIEQGRIAEVFTQQEMSRLTAAQMEERRLRTFDLKSVSYGKETADAKGNASVTLAVQKLCFAWDKGNDLLQDVSFRASGGEVIGLVGKNGTGKTTLGKALSGLIPFRSGTILYNGKKVKGSKLSDQVYFVMQEADHQLYTDSVEAELRLGHKKTPELEEKITEILKSLHLEPFRTVHPYALSGGQKQRVTIAAALLSEKPVIVLDEPTSGLD